MQSTQVISTLTVCPYCNKKTIMRSNINNNIESEIISFNKEISILLFTPCESMGKECPMHSNATGIDFQHVVESKIRYVLNTNIEYMDYIANTDPNILKYVCYHINLESGEYTQRIDMSFIDDAPPEYS